MARTRARKTRKQRGGEYTLPKLGYNIIRAPNRLITGACKAGYSLVAGMCRRTRRSNREAPNNNNNNNSKRITHRTRSGSPLPRHIAEYEASKAEKAAEKKRRENAAAAAKVQAIMNEKRDILRASEANRAAASHRMAFAHGNNLTRHHTRIATALKEKENHGRSNDLLARSYDEDAISSLHDSQNAIDRIYRQHGLHYRR